MDSSTRFGNRLNISLSGYLHMPNSVLNTADYKIEEWVS